MFDEFKNAFQRHNNAHVQLIIINVVIFVIMAVLKVFSTVLGFESVFEIIHSQMALPADWNLFITRPWTIITYAFSHDLTGLFHIFFNMMALYWFGRLFVEYLGSDKLIAIYVLGSLAGAIFYLIAYNTIPYFEGLKSITEGEGTEAHAVTVLFNVVGASAAINAIVVAAAVFLPDYTFFLMFFGPVKIKYIAMVTVFISFLETIGSNAGGNVAHLGGALIGFIYIKQLQSGVNWGIWITVTLDWFKGLLKAKPKVKITYRKTESGSSRSASKSSKTSQAEIDNILDKINEGGYESLSKEEKDKLFNAGKR